MKIICLLLSIVGVCSVFSAGKQDWEVFVEKFSDEISGTLSRRIENLLSQEGFRLTRKGVFEVVDACTGLIFEVHLRKKAPHTSFCNDEIIGLSYRRRNRLIGVLPFENPVLLWIDEEKTAGLSGEELSFRIGHQVGHLKMIVAGFHESTEGCCNRDIERFADEHAVVAMGTTKGALLALKDDEKVGSKGVRRGAVYGVGMMFCYLMCHYGGMPVDLAMGSGLLASGIASGDLTRFLFKRFPDSSCRLSSIQKFAKKHQWTPVTEGDQAYYTAQEGSNIWIRGHDAFIPPGSNTPE